VFQTLYDLLASPPQAYFILLGIAALDAVFPVAPSETAAIVAGLLSALGKLDLGIAIAAGAAGAFVGDNTSYALGRYVGHPIKTRFFSGERAERLLGWARRMLDERGGYVIVVARFIPGGRTAITLTSGIVRFPWLRFAVFDTIAATLWATYAVVLGYVGGRLFEEHPWIALAIALAIAALITAGVEGFRYLRTRAGTGRLGR
jgi:membrane protein DedA with SNARE-associated domain